MRSNTTLAPTRRTRLLISLFAGLLAIAAFVHQAYLPPKAQALSSSIVISQVYGGGGNSGAIYTHDFIELFNRGNTSVSLAGWSVQYTSATGTGNFGSSATLITDLPAVTLAPGQYFLIQEASQAAVGSPLPTPDVVDATPIAMAAGAGKVALVNTTTSLGCNGGSTPCGPAALANIIDLVGYGSANFFEGAGAAPTLSNTTAAHRGGLGCTETDNNNADFAAAAPAPRNTSSPFNVCSGPPSLSINNVSITEGNSGTVTATFTVSLSAPPQVGGVTFDIATADGSATVADNDYVSNTLTGQTIPFGGGQTYSFNVTVNGDTNFENNENFFVNVTNVTGATVADGQGEGTINNDDCAPPAADIVISQVYGGGGNSGAQFTHDFIELFNQGTTTVNLSGWSVQYASATGTSWQVTPLSGTIAPGGYYLIQEGGGANGSPLPTPDATGSILMSATAGKVALSSSTTPFSGTCPTCAVDFVGYGGANCFEGAGATAALSNSSAALRKRGGCFDSDNNNTDFSISSPNPRNSSSPTRSCSFIAVAIHDIQGNGLVTPFLGQDVTTTGVVTARKSNGFFLQTTVVDGDPATSEGIFVFTGSLPAVAVGDAATVQGTATEFFNLTELESSLPGDVMVTSNGNPLPPAVTLTTTILDPAGSLTQLERFEGMLMHADALVSVAPSNEFAEIFTVLDGVARPLREPGIEALQPIPPDPTSGVPDCCIPIWDRNPERIVIDSDGVAGSMPISVTSNVNFSNVTGPLDFSFGNYRILPVTPPTTSANISAVPVPTPASNEFTVAGYNIENFANGDTQRVKTALAIRNVMHSPDIIGHIEILNLASLQALADEVNSQTITAGGSDPMYEARLIPAPAGGTQNVGFLVKTSRIRIDAVTQERASETYINPNTMSPEILHDRPPLVLQATVNPGAINELPVIVVVNHLRSFIDIELVAGDGPRVRAKRKAQAESIAGLLQELQTGNPNTAVVSVGDYNAYQFNDGYTDPIATIKGTPTADEEMVVDASPDVVEPNFLNLTDQLPADQRYTFIFEGTPQALDHVLVNNVAHSLVTRYAVARNNSDFPEVPFGSFAGDPLRPEKNSDHDMPVAYFLAKATTTTTVPNVTATYSSANQTVMLSANVSAANGTVNEGSVTFTVTNSSSAVVGLPVVAPVSGGAATVSYILPGGTLPQALTITANFSGGDVTYPSTGTGTLNVTYAICLLYDPTRAVKSGAAYPIKIKLCEVDGTNASSAGVTVTAVGVELVSTSEVGEVMATGDANPDNNFRFDASLGVTGGYVYNLKTTGLATGIYNLYFTAGNDPVQHAVQFSVK